MRWDEEALVGPDVFRRAGIREVAASAGVSTSTVSNVLNNPDVVSQATRRRVEEAMAEVGYVRNRAARQLRGAPSVVVGCVVLDLANPFFAEMARGMEDRLAEADCVPIVCSTDVRPARQARYLRALEELGVRGVLVSPIGSRLDDLVQLARRGTPVVLVDHPRAGTPLCAVAVDGVRGGELAAAHLVSLGHRRIAFVRGTADVRTLHERAEGIGRALAVAGLDVSRALLEVLVPQPARPDQADAVVDLILAAKPRPTAIICFNDMAAVGVLRGLRRRGVTVPDEISIVGYDDVVFADQLLPALTTVHQPTYQLGRVAAELLLSEADSGHQHREMRFTPELVVRASTAPAPGVRG